MLTSKHFCVFTKCYIVNLNWITDRLKGIDIAKGSEGFWIHFSYLFDEELLKYQGNCYPMTAFRGQSYSYLPNKRGCPFIHFIKFCHPAHSYFALPIYWFSKFCAACPFIRSALFMQFYNLPIFHCTYRKTVPCLLLDLIEPIALPPYWALGAPTWFNPEPEEYDGLQRS